ncbi:hypothetical protein BGP79_02610 [Tersicoccus sp. Bi-70]|nr:hypothetical protein BGP79_02610 [Tersicoccus sp. Bi-70]
MDPDAIPDALLVDRAAGGDTGAFTVLASRHMAVLRGYARRLTGSDADADDAVQDAMVRAWSTIDTLRDPQAVRSWLIRIVSRCAVDLIRARRHHADLEAIPDPADPRPGPEAHVVAANGREALEKALQRLPEGQRQVWILKEIGGLSIPEIVELTGLPHPTVRGRVARSRAQLMEEMKGWR